MIIKKLSFRNFIINHYITLGIIFFLKSSIKKINPRDDKIGK